MNVQPELGAARALFMVLSPHALPYAQFALNSLFANAAEPFHLTMITDSREDKRALEDTLANTPAKPEQSWDVRSEEELADAEADRFRTLPNLRRLRHGHPCWRKITDPLLLNRPGQEIILLDPDLYLPNRFSFEQTLDSGLLLMWQRPNCLFPPDVVQRALDAGVPLARHVDIGVSHWRGDLDFDWLDDLISTLGGVDLPRLMHVEAIIWSAIAMKIGGGYLDPERWVCWRRTQAKRIRVKLGAGAQLLHSEPWERMKCFHAGGEAKWWLGNMLAEHAPEARTQIAPSRIRPFVPLTETRYACEQGAKRMLGRLGYHKLFGAKTS